MLKCWFQSLWLESERICNARDHSRTNMFSISICLYVGQTRTTEPPISNKPHRVETLDAAIAAVLEKGRISHMKCGECKCCLTCIYSYIYIYLVPKSRLFWLELATSFDGSILQIEEKYAPSIMYMFIWMGRRGRSRKYSIANRVGRMLVSSGLVALVLCTFHCWMSLGVEGTNKPFRMWGLSNTCCSKCASEHWNMVWILTVMHVLFI